MRIGALAFGMVLLLPLAARANCCTTYGYDSYGNVTLTVGSSSSCCESTTTPASPTTPADTLKATRDSYQRQIDACIKRRDQLNKEIDALAANLKAYNDALAKLK